MQLRIRSARWEADHILGFRLEPLRGENLPAFTAGSHIEVSLQPGLKRSYSLLNDPAEQDVYEIGVQLDPESRGGSQHIHEHWRPGQVIEVSEPRNLFSLDEDASHSILIAGGIGITPMLSMMERLKSLGRSWELRYAVRSRNRAAFLERLEGLENVQVTIDDEPSTPRLDLQGLIRSAPPRAHVYCCGPTGMLSAFREHGGPLGDRMHFEYFASDAKVACEGGYRLQLQRSGKVIEVAAGDTMLDALLGAGVDVGFACFEGVCGSCRVPVLDGVPDHRDQFLTQAEKDANNAVMACCSGARTASLTLDL
ncbi:PDR/VanB family oxidoreductase [Variovorax sp. J22P168]|uniref:PDR/VanB family oxidoreductase n=1 Tax=Variovorax jilinensis TaxID=3053513 RepID=UPI002577283A|nr:PDR/VanB family oxidoreductase [Variovorax sp. J22P168]MDM0015205.1 PDR/VanB family oxidoreductase [Variovorax sp. J22P168]